MLVKIHWPDYLFNYLQKINCFGWKTLDKSTLNINTNEIRSAWMFNGIGKWKCRWHINYHEYVCVTVLDAILIHSAYPQSRLVVIIVFTHVIRPSVPTFQNLARQNKFQVKTMFTTGETVDLAEWINDDTCLVLFLFSLWVNWRISWRIRAITATEKVITWWAATAWLELHKHLKLRQAFQT